MHGLTGTGLPTRPERVTGESREKFWASLMNVQNFMTSHLDLYLLTILSV
jgi:hypothetical protein